MKITKRKDVTLDVTPNDIADLFCSMDSDEQAIFFNKVAKNIKQWESPLYFQLQAITDSAELTEEARLIMKEIGDYSYNTK